jgi:hypothetical protein
MVVRAAACFKLIINGRPLAPVAAARPLFPQLCSLVSELVGIETFVKSFTALQERLGLARRSINCIRVSEHAADYRLCPVHALIACSTGGTRSTNSKWFCVVLYGLDWFPT